MMNECPLCAGPGISLGLLGSREHFSCRNCGMEFSRKVEENAEVITLGHGVGESVEGISGAGSQEGEGGRLNLEFWEGSDES